MAGSRSLDFLRRSPAEEVHRRDYSALRPLAQGATVGIFLVLFVGFLDLARPFLLPVTAAVIAGMLLHPLTRQAGKWGIPPALTALIFVAILLTACYFGVLLLSGPLAGAIRRAPEFLTDIRSKLQDLEQNFAALRYLQEAAPAGGSFSVDAGSVVKPVLEVLTPALGELLVFFTTLFLLTIGYNGLRRRLILIFPDQDWRLEMIRIFNEVEHNLTRYFGTVTVINACVGLLVTLTLFLLGFPSYAIWGAMAFICNYVPYLGPGLMVLVLFVAGLITFPTVSYALIAPACVVAITTVEGHLVTPNIMGTSFKTGALATFLSLAFWTWLWGPVGTLLAIPLQVIAATVLGHILPGDEVELPE